MPDRRPGQQHSGEESGDQRFERTVRNLLRTPHKPHKDKDDGKPRPKAKARSMSRKERP